MYLANGGQYIAQNISTGFGRVFPLFFLNEYFIFTTLSVSYKKYALNARTVLFNFTCRTTTSPTNSHPTTLNGQSMYRSPHLRANVSVLCALKVLFNSECNSFAVDTFFNFLIDIFFRFIEYNGNFQNSERHTNYMVLYALSHKTDKVYAIPYSFAIYRRYIR